MTAQTTPGSTRLPWLSRARLLDKRPRTTPARLVVGVPLVGNIVAMARARLWLLEQAATVRGGICALPMGARSAVVVSSPDLVNEVLVTRAESFVKGRSFGFLRPVIGNGLLTSEREIHRRQRKLMAPAFAHRRIAAYADTMVAYADRAQAAWTDGTRLDMSGEMMRLTLAIASKTLLDADVEADASDVGSAVSLLMTEVNTRIGTPLSFLLGSVSRHAGARAAIATLDRVILRIIAERRASQVDRGDLLSMLLSAQEEGTGKGMDDRQVRDEVMTIFLAGHETTANALAWSIYLLARHPAAYERLRQETTRVLGGRLATADDLPRLGYALQVFKEALRLYPPAYATSRLATEDVTLGGVHVGQGTDVLVNIYAMQRRPEYFPEPERFDPDRFDPANEKALPRGAYLPFGGGARVCIGNSFALMEGQLVLATLAQKVGLSLVGGVIAPEPLITLRPTGGVPVTVRRAS